MAKRLSKAEYHAYRRGDLIELHAVGMAPTSGYKHFLEQSKIKIFPPEFGFFEEPPQGIVLEVFTPFHEFETFMAKDPIGEIVVHDADGAHKIPVIPRPFFGPSYSSVSAAKPAGNPASTGALVNFDMSRSCRKTVVGRHGSIPEFKTVIKDYIPYLYCRTSSMVIYAEICGPDDLLTQAWNDIIQCAISAGVVAGLAALVSGGAAATGAFTLAFKTCLASKIQDRVNEISVGISVSQEANEDWHRC